MTTTGVVMDHVPTVARQDLRDQCGHAIDAEERQERFDKHRHHHSGTRTAAPVFENQPPMYQRAVKQNRATARVDVAVFQLVHRVAAPNTRTHTKQKQKRVKTRFTQTTTFRAPVSANAHKRKNRMGASQARPQPPPSPAKQQQRAPWRPRIQVRGLVKAKTKRRRGAVIGANTASARYHTVRSAVGGRVTLRGRGGIVIRDNNGTESADIKAGFHVFSVRVQQTGHRAEYGFGGKLVQAFVTSAYSDPAASSALAVFDEHGVTTVRVRVSQTVPRGVLLHLVVLSSVINAQGLHGMHVEDACTTVDIERLSSRKSVQVALFNQYGTAREMGALNVSLATEQDVLPTIDTASIIARPSPAAVTAATSKYLQEFARRTWGAFANGVRFTDGTPYTYDPANDLTTTSESPLPLLFYLFGATRLKAPPGQHDEFADQQIRAGCLMSNVTPSDLASQSDRVKLLVLCNAARALPLTLSVNEEYRGSSFSIPLAAESIGHFAGQCVEQSVLVATVLLHIRDSKSTLCRQLQPVLARYRIGQMLMTHWVDVAEGVSQDLQTQRHLVTALLPINALQALDKDPSSSLPSSTSVVTTPAEPFCMLDTVSSMPISAFVIHPGMASAKESRVMAGILPSEWDEGCAFTDAKHNVGTCLEIHLVDRANDIRQLACITLGSESKGGRASMGIPMHHFYTGKLSSSTHRLWSPVPLTVNSEPFATCQTIFDETLYMTNLYENTADPQYLKDNAAIYSAVARAVSSSSATRRKGWRVVLYDYVPDETPEKLSVLLARSVKLSNERAALKENESLHISQINTEIVGQTVFCANIRATVCVVTYLVVG